MRKTFIGFAVLFIVSLGTRFAALGLESDVAGDFVYDAPYLQWVAETPEHGVSEPGCEVEKEMPGGARWVATPEGIKVIAPGGEVIFIKGEQGLPVEEVTCIAAAPGGGAWAGTARGAAFFDGASWLYFAGRRWLPGDSVRGIAATADGGALVATDAGTGRIARRSMTLEHKANHFDRIMQVRHSRDGFITDSPLRTPGDISTFYYTDDDNDGQWTEMYLGAECFRYAVTRDPEALANARKSLEAMLLLLTISPDEYGGLPARSVLPLDKCPGSDPQNWYEHPNGEICWKGDTSTDEVVGHAFGLPIYYDFCANDEEKRRIAAAFARMMDHIINNGYRLVGIDGDTTKDGHFDPEWINRGTGRLGDRGLNSTEILNALLAAHHITGDEKYLDHYKLLIKEHGYHKNVRDWKKICDQHQTNHDSYEMGYLSFYNLLRYETNENLRRDYYFEGLKRAHDGLLPNRNAEQIVIFGAFAKRDFGLEAAARTLRELPLDLVKHSVFNSHRADIRTAITPDRFGNPRTAVMFPYSEARTIRWSESMLALDSDDRGRSEAMAQFFLLPYWMARFHGMIREN